MAQILKFPVQPSKFGFKRVKSREKKEPGHPDQLNLFSPPRTNIINFTTKLSPFEEALTLDERGDTKAEALYRTAIDRSDCVPDAYCNLGIIESQNGNTAKAFDCFTNSLKADPRHFESHYNLGNLYFDAGDLRLATMHYEMAAEVEPTFPNVYFNLGLVQAMNDNLQAAVSALARYRDLVSEDEGRNADELLYNLKKTLAAIN
jgi:Flp pilus assembly protein TadD